MLTTLPAPRSDISKYAPRIVTLKINPEKIGALIGPGGKNIKRLVEESGCEINIEDDGTVKVFSVSPEGMEIARREIEALSAEIQIGKVYKGRVVTIKEFGAFIEVFPGQDGLVHVSELSNKRVARVEDVIKMGDDIWVKCIGVDEKGRVKLSRKAAMEERGEIPPSTGAPEEGAPAAAEGEARPERAERPERGGDRGGDRAPRGGDRGGRGGDRGADRGGRGERGGRRNDAPAGGEGEGSGEPLEIGKIYRAKVVTIKDFGAFVEFLPGREGLVHVSELANFRVKQVEDIVQLGDEIWVKLLGQDEKGRVRLSRKAAMEEREKAASGDAPAASESANGGSSADAQE
jgi:predicted RNA-binding protein with RPS1 domain